MGTWTAEDLLIAFDSTHAAMAAQKALERAGVAFSVIPTPRTITASCGITLAVRAGQAAEARTTIEGCNDIAALCAFYSGEAS